MKLIHIALALSLVCAVLVVAIAFQPELGALSQAHPTIAGMSVGSGQESVSATVSLLAYTLQNVVIVLSLTLLAMGVSPRYRTVRFYRSLVLIGGVMVAVWAAIYWGNQDFYLTGETAYVLGFPVASAWMIYGVWGSSALLTVFYVIGFKRFIYTDADRKAFEALLDTNQQVESGRSD